MCNNYIPSQKFAFLDTTTFIIAFIQCTCSTDMQCFVPKLKKKKKGNNFLEVFTVCDENYNKPVKEGPFESLRYSIFSKREKKQEWLKLRTKEIS